jgi:hypothetical protein
MYLYVLQLFNTDYREDMILALTTAGIKQATVVEGINLDNILTHEFPLFTGLLRGPADRERYSQLIFGMVEDQKALDAFVEVLRQAGIDNRREQIYKLLVVQGQKLG